MASERYNWLSGIPIGLIHTRSDSLVTFATKMARHLLGLGEEKVLDGSKLSEEVPELWMQLQKLIFQGRTEEKGSQSFVIQTKKGQFLEVTVQRDAKENFVFTIKDVTEFEMTKRQTMAMLDEIDKAFSFSLLEPSVEQKLKSTPEYKDESVGPETIRITEVIPDGTYRHVINILKLAADLSTSGLFEFPGISRKCITDVAIYHDLAKAQPLLKEGDIVVPGEVFPPGKVHAQAGAELGRAYYGLKEDVCRIIRYHHHEEEELPDDFPSYLLPQLRLFRILDGLSAGMTRRSARISIAFEKGWLYVGERNPIRKYESFYAINLYSGITIPLPAGDFRLQGYQHRTRDSTFDLELMMQEARELQN